MNRPKQQGTRWESELVHRAHDEGLMSSRLAEGGSADSGDVWIINPPGDTTNTRVALAWKRLNGSSGHRTPDGVRDGVFITTADFLDLLRSASIVDPDVGWIVECKATQNLNVTRTLDRARRKAIR